MQNDETSHEIQVLSPYPELVNLSPDQVRVNIINACNEIDKNQNDIRNSAMKIGYQICLIRNELEKICKDRNLILKNELGTLLKHRFDRSVAWGYRMMMIYKTFQIDDPIIDLCTTSDLVSLATLKNQGVDIEELKLRIISGEKVSLNEINAIEKLIDDAEKSNEIFSESQSQLIELESELRRSQLANERKDKEISEANKSLRDKEAKNESLMQQLREKQDAERNIVIENQNTHDDLVLTIKNLKDDLEKVKSTPEKIINVDVVPEGFTSIEEAIAIKSAELKEHELQLEAVLLELNKSKESILSKEKASAIFKELHSDFVASSMKVIEVMNFTDSEQIHSNKIVIQNIVSIIDDIQSNLTKQLA